ncbi:osmoprotectant transport system ATP-binding protein [Sphingobium sp. B2D3A]|uniref:ATP-binding cassette domain-containing protein n=1 Tax=unclassified Sphingobium TaxID=2611147 RepID=UPI0022257E82|nr:MULTISPECIES: ATP-binding cassette domain-containing protein [unclassified Sphingobium]MCW2337443.1 osmoprotectant transport system ATP-binding protein [Sphingobium sp. B2D3A]MCW2383901.1 osmoprotectant transport system ATP-binding protein [Sphingobium sp. B2D3D]
MSQADAIALESVAKSFDGGRTFATHDVDLHIGAGSFVALVGASGSGKTTLLKCINRLIEPDSGIVRIHGEPVNDRPAYEVRREIGYVFQGIGLFPHLSVAENIGLTPRLLGWPAQDVARRVAELLALVELPEDYGVRMPDALSGGQRQRVGIARALAARPGILLMDEPFGALDPITRDTLGRACRRLHETLGLTTVLVTHDVFEAVLLADRIVMLEGGRIIADDTPHRLLTDPPNEAVRALMAMPMRQAEQVRRLIAVGPDGTG